MLSNNSPTDALLSHYKPVANPILTESKKDIVSDQIDPPPKKAPNQQPTKSKPEPKGNKKQNDKKKRQKRFTFILKIFNIVLGVLLAAFGIYCYYGVNDEDLKDFKLIGYIMPGYLTLSGLIIVAIEMRIDFICRNMKFLYNYFGRGFFNIYVGIMPLTLLDSKQNSQKSHSEVLQTVAIYILVGLMLFVGVLYIVAKLCCCAKQDQKTKRQSKQKNDSQSESSENDD